MRKEQENDARLNEKERELTSMIEVSEHQLLSVRQRLMDQQKQARENLSPEQMLLNLKNDVRQNKEICKSGLEYALKYNQEKENSIKNNKNKGIFEKFFNLFQKI